MDHVAFMMLFSAFDLFEHGLTCDLETLELRKTGGLQPSRTFVSFVGLNAGWTFLCLDYDLGMELEQGEIRL